MGRVFGFLEVNSARKNWKIYLIFKILEILGFLDLGLSLEPDTWFYLFGHGISQTQPIWGHTQNFSSFGPLILHLPGGGWISPPLTQMCSWDPLTIRVKDAREGGDTFYSIVSLLRIGILLHLCVNRNCVWRRCMPDSLNDFLEIQDTKMPKHCICWSSNNASCFHKV